MNLLDLTSMVNSVFYAIFLYSNIFRFSKFIFGDIVCSRSLSRFYVTVYTMRIGHQVLDVQYIVNSSDTYRVLRHAVPAICTAPHRLLK